MTKTFSFLYKPARSKGVKSGTLTASVFLHSLQKISAFLMILAVFSPTLLTAKHINQKNEKKSLTETQKIIHVLNRLGFGVRAGDGEKFFVR